MFESIEERDPAIAVRRIAVAPLGAFLIELAYLTLAPLLGPVPAALFWLIVAILFAGTIAGLVGIVCFLSRNRARGRVLAWMIAACVVTIVCGLAFLSLVAPWL